MATLIYAGSLDVLFTERPATQANYEPSSRRTTRREVVSAESRDENAGTHECDAEHAERELVGARLVKTEAHQHGAQAGPHGEDGEHASVDLAIGAQSEVTAKAYY